MGQIFKKIRDFYFNRSYLGYFFVAFFGLAFFSLIQATGTFLDPDSFYHAKMTALMLKQGVVRDFPHLAYTVLPQIYTDHHFLYHILLAPFISKIYPLLGIKIATTVINTSFIVLFYAFLKKNGARWPFLFVFLLLSSTPFIFRINLAKANGLSLVFIILILFAIFKKKNIWLGFLSFLYVWAYGGWPLGIFLGGTFLIASMIANLIKPSPSVIARRDPSLRSGQAPQSRFSVRLPRALRVLAMTAGRAEWRPFAATILGSAAGLIINPYFPQNLKFYWIQIVQIALVNYQTKIGVGAEWYGFNVLELVSFSGGVFLILGFAILLFFGNLVIKKKGIISYEAVRDIFFFLICAGLFFVITIKSVRNTEYFFPFILLLSAFIIKYFYNGGAAEWIKKNLRKIFRLKILYNGFFIYLALMISAGFAVNFWKIKKGFEGGFEFLKYKGAMAMAQENSDKGDIIFHSDWDDWPMLFYHNDYNRYIVGLDTTFMYKYSKDLYKKWRDITWGDFAGDPYKIIKDDFKASLIYIAENDIEIMDKYFENDKRYELIYDGDGKVYKIITNY